MGVKENPSIPELMCYFCNLSLDLQTRAPQPRNHQTEEEKKKTGAVRPTFVDTVNLPKEVLQRCEHIFW